MLVFEPLTSGLWGRNYTTRPPWQVSLKGVKVCAQQSMTNHLQFGDGQWIRPIWKNHVKTFFQIKKISKLADCDIPMYILQPWYFLRSSVHRVAMAQGIWLLTFPDRENTGNVVNFFFFYTGKILNFLKILLTKWQQGDGAFLS